MNWMGGGMEASAGTVGNRDCYNYVTIALYLFIQYRLAREILSSSTTAQSDHRKPSLTPIYVGLNNDIAVQHRHPCSRMPQRRYRPLSLIRRNRSGYCRRPLTRPWLFASSAPASPRPSLACPASPSPPIRPGNLRSDCSLRTLAPQAPSVSIAAIAPP
jgi:hypothetical protein